MFLSGTLRFTPIFVDFHPFLYIHAAGVLGECVPARSGGKFVTAYPAFPLKPNQTVALFLLLPCACAMVSCPTHPVVLRRFSHKFLQGPEGKRIGDLGPMGRILIRYDTCPLRPGVVLIGLI